MALYGHLFRISEQRGAFDSMDNWAIAYILGILSRSNDALGNDDINLFQDTLAAYVEPVKRLELGTAIKV